jgi:thiol-disulfide isomerase/thioredoxin
MKKFILLFSVLLVVWSCKEKTVHAFADVVEEKVTEDYSPIPIYDFEALEEAFFNKEDELIYVINFWATWCKPCVKELPAFEQLNKNYKNEGVKVVLVSLDFPEKIKTGVIPFIEKHELQSHVVLLDDPDANTWIPKVSEEWSGAIPATVIVKDGKKTFYERSFTYVELETEIKATLN